MTSDETPADITRGRCIVTDKRNIVLVHGAFGDGSHWRHDLDDSESLVLATTQRPLARRCYHDHAGEPAWKTKQSWYQVSTQDRIIRPETERWMAERVHAREIIEIDTSHASFATRPTEVLELITSAADAV